MAGNNGSVTVLLNGMKIKVCLRFAFVAAWSLQGIENLLMDFYLHPQFVHSLLDAICDYNIAQVDKAFTFDIDAVYFGDD